MAGRDPNFWMLYSESTQLICQRSKNRPDQPFRSIIFETNGSRIRHMEVPAIIRTNGHTTVSARMTIQWYKPHLRLEGQADRRQSEPGLTLV